MLTVAVHRSKPRSAIVAIAGDLVAATAAQVRAVELPGVTGLELDLRNVKAVDRPGLGALVSVVRRARAFGSEVSLRLDDPSISQLWRSEGGHRLADLVA